MTSSAAEIVLPNAVAVEASDVSLSFAVADGRTISIPLSWSPRLADATPAERNHWRLIGIGEGMHSPDLDEDISVDAVIRGRPSAEASTSLQRWRSARRRRHG